MNSSAIPSSEIRQFNSGKIISKYDFFSKLKDYFEFLLDYNQKVNLVSRETSTDDLYRIAADCLVPFEYSERPTGRIFDIGPGGGFPSIILLLAFPNLKADLIERTTKKVEYLKQAAKSFNLSARIINGNFNDIGSQLDSNSYNYGFLKLVKLDQAILNKASGLLLAGGRFVYYHRPLFKISNPGQFSESDFDYYLDDNNKVRSLTIFRKK